MSVTARFSADVGVRENKREKSTELNVLVALNVNPPTIYWLSLIIHTHNAHRKYPPTRQGTINVYTSCVSFRHLGEITFARFNDFLTFLWISGASRIAQQKARLIELAFTSWVIKDIAMSQITSKSEEKPNRLMTLKILVFLFFGGRCSLWCDV